MEGGNSDGEEKSVMMHHDHDHESASHRDELSVSDAYKLVKMVEHWIRHNEDHERSYRDWAERAREMGQEQVYTILLEVARESQVQNLHLQKVLKALGSMRNVDKTPR